MARVSVALVVLCHARAADSAGTPAPLPCPFCGGRDDVVSVVIERMADTGSVRAYIQCEGCGCQSAFAMDNDEEVVEAVRPGVGSGPYCTVLEAAKRWNARAGS